MIKTNETNKTNIKYGALFFNRSGIDECYGRVSGSSDSEIINEFCILVDFANGIPLTDFDLVGEWEGSEGGTIKVYSFDGISIYIGDYELPPTKELSVMKRRIWTTITTTNKRKSTRV